MTRLYSRIHFVEKFSLRQIIVHELQNQTKMEVDNPGQIALWPGVCFAAAYLYV